MKTAADKAARDQLIKLFIEAGSRGAVEAAAVRDQLQSDVDKARAEYIEAATTYAASYETDIKGAADQLQHVREQLQGTRAEIAAARDNIAMIERCGTEEKAAELREGLQKIQQRAAELEKKVAALGAYIPAGDPSLLKAAEKADKRWRSEKAIADRIAAGIDKNITDKAAELLRAQTEIRAGVWSAVYIPAAMKVSELRRRGRKGPQLQEILKQREKAAGIAAEIRHQLQEIRTGSAANEEAPQE